jgi:hypothetical protein
VKATLNNGKFFESVRPNLAPSDEMSSGGGGEKITIKAKGNGMQPDPAANMPTKFTESQKVAGVLLSCPEFQRR